MAVPASALAANRDNNQNQAHSVEIRRDSKIRRVIRGKEKKPVLPWTRREVKCPQASHGCTGWNRTRYLQGMNLPSYQCSTVQYK